MKNKFNFLQIANWIYICITNLKKIKNSNITNKEKIEILTLEKRKILLVKDIINKKATLHGISPEFLKKLGEIKKEYGLKD